MLLCYSVSREEAMKAHTEELGIPLIFIPPGLTDKLQPLNRFVFGAMKGMFRQLYVLHC
jgi:hypothetical protein